MSAATTATANAAAHRTLSVLLVASCPARAATTSAALRHGLPDTVVMHVAGLDEAVDSVSAASVDVVVVHVDRPAPADVAVLRALIDAGLAVVVAGPHEDIVAGAAQEAGAQSHLCGDGLTSSQWASAVRCAISTTRAEQSAASSRLWAQSILDAIESPTCVVDSAGTITSVNAAWTCFGAENGGDPLRTSVGVNYLTVCESSADPRDVSLGEDLRRLLHDRTGRVALDYPCDSDGARRWFSLRATPLAGGGAVLTHLDVTTLRLAHARLDVAATRDPLTGLLNRQSFVHDLDRRLGCLQPGQELAVFFIDLDRFQLVNDTLGHASADLLLVRVGEELSAAVRRGDAVARHGGDEFVVLADIGDEEVAVIADRLQAATCQRLRIGDVDVDVSATVGMAVSRGESGDTAEELLQAVDDAMHEAKATGRGSVGLDHEGLRTRVRARAQLFRELQGGVEQEQFVLHFQPIVVPDTNRIHAVEALIRWQHPERGLLAPDQFLDVAEATGLITPIGAWVIQAACAHGQRLHEAGLHMSMAVNLSAKQVNDPATVTIIADALEDSGFPPHALIIEVTETSMIDDTDTALSTMRAIKALGVQLAVDDFGTGYSSLAYLKRYPIDGLKIDRSFVRDILTDRDDRAIVTRLLQLARDLDVWAVVEGVETLEQQQALQAIGCTFIQGFYYARPVPAEELPAVALLLAERARLSAPRASKVPRPRVPAERFDATLVDRMATLRSQGMSHTTIAAVLNCEGHTTMQGVRWHPRSVGRALAAQPQQCVRPHLPVS